MDENIYRPPEADLTTPRVEGDAPFFYVVSVGKFTVLFFGTLGMYSVYWFYRNWKLYRDHYGLDIWPIPRAIFNIFFTHSLFEKVDNVLESDRILDEGAAHDWNPRSQATMWVVVAIVGNILDRLSGRGIGSPYTDILAFLTLPVLYAALLPAQRAINVSQGDPTGSGNQKLTGWNYFWLALGLVLWLFAIVGMLMIFGIVAA